MKRLQLRHHDELFTSRELALNFFSDILNPENIKNGKFGTSLYAEPMVVKYTDSDGKTQILFAIGTDTPNAPYHIIDSAELSERIDNEITRAIAAEAILQNNIDAEVARAKDAESVLDKKINDEVLRATAEEARLQGAIDAEVARAMEAESVLDKKIDETLTSIVSIEPSSANVLEEYALKNNKNELLGEHIKIYKDSSLVGAVNGFKGAKMVEKMADGSFVLTYDEALRDESVEYLYLVYRNEEGNLKLIGIDFENFLMEAEFGDGMKVVDHVASIKIKDGEKYLETSKDGIYTINIDKAINDSVNEEKLRAEAEETRLQGAIDAEVARAMDVESVLDKKFNDEIVRATAEEARLQGAIDAEVIRAMEAESVLDKKASDEITRATEEEAKINAEVKANKINSKDVVLNVTENGTNLTIQTDEVTITKKANAETIYDTNIAVLGTLLQVKKVEPLSTNIKSRYELQGADGKLIGDPIELAVESALIDVKQGKVGDSIDPETGNYISEGDGDTTMNFVYRLENGTYELVQIVVSEYFTDSHFGRGLNNQDGVISLKEGGANEYLVINENTIEVVGVNAAINVAKEEVKAYSNSYADNKLIEANTYTDGKVIDLTSYVNTFVGTAVDNVTNALTASIQNESNRAIAAEDTLANRIESEENSRLESDNQIRTFIGEESSRVIALINQEVTNRANEITRVETIVNQEIINRTAADEALKVEVLDETKKEARTIATEEVAKIVAGADESFDTLKEIGDWILSDTTGAAKMVADIENLKVENATIRTNVEIVNESIKPKAYECINDSLIVNTLPVTEITPDDAFRNGSLLRKVKNNGKEYYYVSNKATEMYYVKEDGTQVILNDYIKELETKVVNLEERITVLEENGTSVSPEEVKTIIKEYLKGFANEIDIKPEVSENGVETLVVKFADDAIFG